MSANIQALQQGKNPANKRWFRSPDDGRLRAGWRIVAFLGIFYAIALPLVFGLRAVLEFSKSSSLVVVLIAVAATPAVYIARRWIDKKSLVSLGLRLDKSAVADLLFGFSLSGIMAGSVFVAMLSLGYIGNIQLAASGWSAVGLLAGPLLVMACVGFWEELVFRGYILRGHGHANGNHNFLRALRAGTCNEPQCQHPLFTGHRPVRLFADLRLSQHRPAVAFNRHAHRVELLPGDRFRLCSQRSFGGSDPHHA